MGFQAGVRLLDRCKELRFERSQYRLLLVVLAALLCSACASNWSSTRKLCFFYPSERLTDYPGNTAIKSELAKIADVDRRIAVTERMGRQGDAGAQYLLALSYTECLYRWSKEEKDLQYGLNWLERAVQTGHPQAQQELAEYLVRGNGRPQDFAQAHRLYQSAAKTYGEWPLASITAASDAASSPIANALLFFLSYQLPNTKIPQGTKQYTGRHQLKLDIRSWRYTIEPTISEPAISAAIDRIVARARVPLPAEQIPDATITLSFQVQNDRVHILGTPGPTH